MIRANLLWVTLVCTSCAFDPATCEIDADCPVDAYCALRPGEGSAACLPLGGDGADDAGGPEVDGADAPDDTDIEDREVSQPGSECETLDDCAPDDSNPPRSTPLVSTPVGCPRSEFVGLSQAMTIALCAQNSDLWTLDYVRCADKPFTVELTVTTGAACVADFDLDVDGHHCGDEGVECEVRGDGTHRVKIQIPSSNFPTPIETLEIFVSSSADEAIAYSFGVNVTR